MLFQAVMALGEFYLPTNIVPPRLPVFAVLPAVILIVVIFAAGRDFVAELPLIPLTVIHAIRIPVELTLAALFEQGLIPREMTFHGWNHDIISGILAIIISLFAFRNRQPNRKLLIGFNIIGLLLLANIVTIAMLAVQSPIQKLAFDHPNRGVLYFPYVWLPAMIVPVVLFCHLASLYKLLKAEPSGGTIANR